MEEERDEDRNVECEWCRAALNKDAADWWNSQDLDVLCLQEIKAIPEQLPRRSTPALRGSKPFGIQLSVKGILGWLHLRKRKPSKSSLGWAMSGLMLRAA